MFGLTTANNTLSTELRTLDVMIQNAKRLTKEEYRDTIIAIADLRNKLNCLEENLPHVRP